MSRPKTRLEPLGQGSSVYENDGYEGARNESSSDPQPSNSRDSVDIDHVYAELDNVHRKHPDPKEQEAQTIAEEKTSK